MLGKLASQILENNQSNVTFKTMDVIIKEMIKSTTELNPNDTFKITYTGPYIFNNENEGFKITHGINSVRFSLKIRI